ncbi:MAG TPA: four helix bundle protein [Thermoanaerobaculia bacterium]
MKSTYRDLLVWHKAMDLIDDIDRITRQFPKEEMYGLTAQMRRSSASIAYNIAEGQGCYTFREFRLHALAEWFDSIPGQETSTANREPRTANQVSAATPQTQTSRRR